MEIKEEIVFDEEAKLVKIYTFSQIFYEPEHFEKLKTHLVSVGRITREWELVNLMKDKISNKPLKDLSYHQKRIADALDKIGNDMLEYLEGKESKE